MTGCVGRRAVRDEDDDTLIKCDEANGQCGVACSSLSASEKPQPSLPFAGSNTQGNTLFVVREVLLSAWTAVNGQWRGVG